MFQSSAEIRFLHIELSSICNARCPLCPRNLFGYPHNFGYKETNLTLDLIKKSFSTEFIQQLRHILINGNFGDFVSNPESVEIIRYFRQSNKKAQIRISTNGSARTDDFWQELATIGDIEVRFCLEGLEDTHHLYRQDTNWKKILHNAKIFIEAGGIAVWKMIKFDHNLHQIESCQKLSKELGFAEFLLVDEGRSDGPVFDRNGNLSHIIGKWDGPTTIEDIIKGPLFVLGVFDKRKKISCYAKNSRSIYVSADGKVYPCCWLGFSPETFENQYFTNNNKQIKEIMTNNSLHDFDLETCMQWFKNVENSWTKKSYQEGLIRLCDRHCGHS
jgi:MoaA/NifB/PqqE/SkfB family radical SAM enzyme